MAHSMPRSAALSSNGLKSPVTQPREPCSWLDRRPDPKLLIAWTHLVQAISEQLGPDGTARLKTGLLDRARAVAAATGGLFGVGSKISAPEAAMLAKLEAAFPSSP
jgi:hypothetical protein